jgi:hypothetical protein
MPRRPRRRPGPGWIGGACLLSLALPFAGAATPDPAGQPGSPIRVGEDRPVPVGGPDVPLVEPHLSVDPRDGDHWVAGVIALTKTDLSETDCAALTTFDGGRTWKRRDLGLKDCADPWTAILPGGTVVLAVLGKDQMLIYRSEDGGRTWSGPPLGLGEGHDHETLAVDRTSGPRSGSVYALSVQPSVEPASGKPRDAVFIARSDDGGKSFGEPTRVFPSNLGFNTLTGAVLSDGTLAVSYADFQRPGLEGTLWLEHGRSWLVISRDGGRTFSGAIWIGDGCGRSFPVLAADESRGPFRDRLYWLCNGRGEGRTVTPDFEQILLQRSADRGERWSDAVRVNAGSGRRPYVRTAAIALDGAGAVAVSWYDGRNEKEKVKTVFQCLDVYVAISRDGGESFLPEVRVSSQSGCADVTANGKGRYRWPAGGDYSGLAARPGGGFQLLWSDARDGPYRLRTSTVSLTATEGKR